MCVLLYALALLLTSGVLAHGAPLTLAWDYASNLPPASGSFIVQRSLNGAAWEQVGSLALRSGTITWRDSTLPETQAPYTVRYQVYATPTVAGWTQSPPSNEVAFSAGGQPLLPQSSIAVAAVDSQETAMEDGTGKNVLDGNPATLWHTAWSTQPPPRVPHWIILDLGEVRQVDGLIYQPRQDNSWNGTIKDYAVSVSRDQGTWGEPVATGTWQWFWPAMVTQTIRFPATQGRYVRLEGKTEVEGDPWISAAELGIYAGEGGGGAPPVEQVQCREEMTGQVLTITCLIPAAQR